LATVAAVAAVAAVAVVAAVAAAVAVAEEVGQRAMRMRRKTTRVRVSSGGKREIYRELEREARRGQGRANTV